MIITLCGSARFEPFFHLWNEILTVSGHAVFGLSVYPSLKSGNKNWYSPEIKKRLDEAHLKKIDASDAIFVLNPFAYLGESTLKEISYARYSKKQLFALESWGEGRGLSPLHFEKYRKAAERYSVHEFNKSPIDTTFSGGGFQGWQNLLPEAGKFRSGLVETIYEFNREHHGSQE